MRHASRSFVPLAILVFALGSGAHAAPRRDTDGPNILGSGRSPSATLAAALAMPAVRTAMNVFDSRGYQRMPEYDYGGSFGDTAVALIGYRIPGIEPEQRQPVITVISRPIAGQKITDIRGGVVERVDGTLRGVTDPAFAPFQVSIADMSSTQASNYSVQGDPLTDQQWANWLMCSFSMCVECSAVNLLPVLGQMICCIVFAVICHKSIVA
jgi:hypothetical protein